jgi:flavin reductase (DIM6/NTAB) family NADH-FMN oxidoreductase RutF/rubredoxin
MNLKILYKIGYGMYIVSSKEDEKFNGQIANTVFQVTSEPPAIAVSINKQNLTHKFIEKSKVFVVSILSRETPMEFIGRFGFKSGRDIDKFKSINHKAGITGAPAVLENTVGYLEAEVVNSKDAGTHTVFIGKIVSAETIKEGEPMTYAYYHEVKKGTAPKAAPTYIDIKKEESEGTGETAKYRCTVCGYIYDPEKGDLSSDINPGTPFEQLPDNWVCPVCGASKDKFVKEQ